MPMLLEKIIELKVRNLNKEEVKELEPNIADVYYAGQLFIGSRHTNKSFSNKY